MARTAIAVQTITKNTGATVSLAAADSGNGMLFPNDGQTELLVKNAGGTTCNVTVRSVPDPYGRTSDLEIAVAGGAEAAVPVLDPLLFNQTASDIGSVYVDFDESTSVTVAAVRRG